MCFGYAPCVLVGVSAASVVRHGGHTQQDVRERLEAVTTRSVPFGRVNVIAIALDYAWPQFLFSLVLNSTLE